MSQKLMQTMQLFRETKSEITNNISTWQGYLSTASRLYKYSFDDQLLISAQKPDATACAKMELWNNQLNRWVKSGSKGIALIKHHSGQKPQLEYVFDISDTREVKGAKKPYLWQMRESVEAPVLDKLSQLYGRVTTEGDFASKLMEYCARAVGEQYREFIHDLTYDLEDSFLEGFDELNIDVVFRNAVTVSTQYMVLLRCGIDPSIYLEDDDFATVLNFNTSEVISHFGNALNTVSKDVLLAIAEVVRKEDLEISQNHIAKTPKIEYTENIEFNALKRESEKEDTHHEQEPNLLQKRGLHDTRPDTGTRGISRHSGQIWDAERNTSQDTQGWNLQQDADRRESVATLGGSGQTSRGASGLHHAEDDEITGRDGTVQGAKSNALGADGDQYQGTGRGTSPSGNDLLLKDFITIDPKAETYLSAILTHDIHFKNKLEDISAYFSAHLNNADRANYLKGSFNKDYTELTHDGVSLGYMADDNWLTLWKGSHTARESESKLSWDLAAGFMNNIALPKFKKEQETTQISLFPSVEQQIENIVTAKAEETSSVFSYAQDTVAIPDDVVDKIISTGRDWLPDKNLPLIVGHFSYNTNLEENVNFIKNHYDTGGKGFEIDGQKYALWYDKMGMQIAKGTSVRTARNKISLSWEDVANKIRTNLETGNFVSDKVLDSFNKIYLHHVAEQYAYMYRDRDENYTNEKLDNILTRFGFTTCQEIISEHFTDKAKLKNMLEGLREMEQDHQTTEGGVMRLRFYDPSKTIAVVKDFENDPVVFPKAQDSFFEMQPSFITEDEIDHIFIKNATYLDERKVDNYLFLTSDADSKSMADFLKNQYGTGGGGSYGTNTSYSPKGLEFSRGKLTNPYQKLFFNWNQVAQKIQGYIKENRYLSQKEREYIPQFTKEKVAVEIKSFYRYAAKDLTPPFSTNDNDDYWDSVKMIAGKFEEEGFFETITQQMEYALQHTLSDERGFDSMKEALDAVTAYTKGEYKVYAKGEFVKPSIDDDLEENVEEGTPNDLSNLAKKLERKRKTTLKSDDYGQLSLDFTMGNPVASILEEEQGLVVSEELITYAKEQLDETATTKEVADKVAEIIATDEKDVILPVQTIMYSDFASEFVKSSSDFVDQEMSLYTNDDGKRFAFGYGNLGNGTTVWNYLDTENSDYKTVAHISEDGALKLYDKDLPPLATKELEEKAFTFYPQEKAIREILEINGKYTFNALKTEFDAREVSQTDLPINESFRNYSKNQLKLALNEQVKQTNEKGTPVWREYLSFKETHKDNIVLFQLGDFFEAFHDDAKATVEHLGLSLHHRDVKDFGRVPMTGIPSHRLDDYVKMLGEKGFNITVVKSNDGVREPIHYAATKENNINHHEKLIQGERSVIKFLEEKAEHPSHIIGVQAGDLLLFYGQDAKQVATAIGRKAIERTIPELGSTTITGEYVSDWVATAEKLRVKGIDFKLFGEQDGSFYLMKDHEAKDYIPLGMEIDVDGRKLKIEAVDYSVDKVSLRDVSFEQSVGYPILRNEPVQYVRDYVVDAQDKQLELLVTIENTLLDQDIIQDNITPDIIFFEDFKDVQLDYGKYNDGDVIGYNKDGVKYTVGKSGSMVYTTTTTSITPYGEVLGDSMTPGVFEQFKAWQQGKNQPAKDNITFEFDGGEIQLTTPTKQVAKEETNITDNSPKRNFSITNDDLGAGTAKEKFTANFLAIETLKSIEQEHRRATPEEQEILSGYVGFGGIPEAFDENKTAWSKEYQQLKNLLTDDEYTKARASTLNAHYTSPVVIRSMYEALETMGIPKDSNVLEPACGTGNFFGMLPDGLKESKLYGCELDSLTGRIAKQLYPNADIHIKGFEKTTFSDSFFDVAVGNVPFGNYKLADKRYDKHNFLIHDYFFGATLDKVRTGGIVAFITSKGTLDKENTAVREYLAQRADLLGAIRLPNTAFKANAGTEVTSDIIFLQKRETAPTVMPSWVGLGQTEDGIAVNKYFEENPQMIMGKMEMQSGPFGMESTCSPSTETTLAEQLKVAISNLIPPDKELLNARSHNDEVDQDTSITATSDVRNFSYTVVDDKVYYRENSRMNEVKLNDTAKERVKALITLRDKTRDIIEMQLEECSDIELQTAQAQLNSLYDSYNKKHGLINSRGSKQAFMSDVSYPLLCSLEKLDEEGNLKGKADMFTKRTIKNTVKITSVDTPSEALAVSISEKACVDIGFMASLLGGSEKIQEVIDGLSGVIFKDPLSNKEDNLTGWMPSDEYLSGNVREKLAVAKAVAENHPEYNANVELLEKVQPKDLSASEIDVRIGATWIDPKYYAQFVYELLGTPKYLQGKQIDVRYSKHTGEWNISSKSFDRANPKSNATYGTKRKNAYEIIEDSLNLRDVRIYDKVTDDEGLEKRVLNGKETTLAQQKQEMIGEAFREWIWKDPTRREVLAKKYNEIYNSTRPREFDGRHIKFEGMTPLIQLNTHQRNAVARTMYGGNSLLAHCVGAGKTFTMIASAMEGKRLGLQQKSLFVVPNHLTEQMGADIYQLYPGAKVLVATKKDFEPLNRKAFCSRIATGDFDIVVIGHTQFEKIPLSVARQEAIFEKQIGDIMLAIEDAKAQNSERYTIKQLEKTKKSLETRLEKLSSAEKKDSVVTFEELGVDKLYVDEGHNFKNLFLHTKMRNVAGIGQSEAQKSTDMFTKCQYMDELTGGKGIVFATGTPVSNSMVELYTMMRYLQYNTLGKLDLTHFDSWAANFGEKVTAIELAPEGTGFRAKTRFAKFFNLPELINIWKEAADIQTADMLNLPVPKAEHITEVTKPSEFQKDMVKDLAKRAKDVRNRVVDAKVDNMLKITSDGRKLALDQRLGNDMLSDDEHSKVNKCVENVFQIWEETTDKKSTQLIFSDLSTPHYDGTFNVYDDIKNKLIEKGVPPEEIKFIHDANTEVQKAELFAKVRQGKVRVLLGSTGKMGAGTNVQTKLVALHHVDCPWRPADLEQREGRIIRQGNENENIKVFKYVTEGTFDSYNWSLIENKQKFIGQIFTSKSPARSADDVDATALSYAEVKALATGDPRFKEKMDLDIQVAKLKLMRANHNSVRYEMEDKVIKFYPTEIKKTQERIDGLLADQKVTQANPVGEDNFSMKIRDKVYTDKKQAGEAIIEVCNEIKNPEEQIQLGEYRGFPMTLSIDSGKFVVSMKNILTHRAELEKNITGNITRINNALESIPKRIDDLTERLHQLNGEMESAKIEADTSFPKENEYIEKSQRLAELNTELDNEQEQEEEITEETQEKPSVLQALKSIGQEAVIVAPVVNKALEAR